MDVKQHSTNLIRNTTELRSRVKVAFQGSPSLIILIVSLDVSKLVNMVLNFHRTLTVRSCVKVEVAVLGSLPQWSVRSVWT